MGKIDEGFTSEMIPILLEYGVITLNTMYFLYIDELSVTYTEIELELIL